MRKISSKDAYAQAIALASVRYRWLVIATAITFCGVIGYGASTLKFAADYRVFFGADNPDFIANEKSQGTFGKPDNIAFVVINPKGDIYNKDTLTAVHELTEASWRLPYVSRVDSITNFQNTEGDGDDLIVENLLLHPSDLSADRLSSIRTVAESEPLVRGFVASEDGKATVVNAVVQTPSDVPNATSAVASKAREIRDEIQAEYPSLEIHITGVAALSAAFEEAGVQDSSTLIPAVYLLILLVMWVTLRSVAAVFAGLLLIALSTLVGMGVGGFLGVALTPISLSAPIVILTIAVADSIHLISSVRSAMRSGRAKKEAIVEAKTLNFSPILITSATTIVGFLTLNFSDSPPFHHLGNMSAAGIAAAWVLSITFLPAMLSLLPLSFAKPSKNRVELPDRLASLADTIAKQPRKILFVTLGPCALLIAMIPLIELNDQWSEYFAPSLEFRQAIDAAEPYFGSDQIEFIVDPGTPGSVTDPTFLTTIDHLSGYLRESDKVAHVFSVSDIMKRVNRNLNGDDPSFYRIPDNKALASQYLLVYELSLPYGLGVDNRVDIDRQTTRLTATMRDISTEETKAFLADVNDWFDQNGSDYTLVATGSKVLFANVAQRNIEAMFEGAVYLITAIFLILALSFRSISLGAISILPNALPILATFGLWAITVGSVGFSVAAVGAVSVGLVVDYTVHFLSKYTRARQEQHRVVGALSYAFRTAGTAIVATTTILAVGFAALATSTFKLNADMGMLTAIAVIFAMLINFLLLPSLFLLRDRNNTSVKAAYAKPESLVSHS